MNSIIYVIPAFGIIGIIAMSLKSAWVRKQDPGDAKMQELSGYIADGAMAFLKAEWKILGYFAVFTAIILGWSGTRVEDSSPIIALSFLCGAVLSAFAGFLGMKIATKANVRMRRAQHRKERIAQ